MMTNVNVVNKTNIKGEKATMERNTVVFNKQDLQVIQDATKQISDVMKKEMGLTSPTLYTFLGSDTESMAVSNYRNEFTAVVRGKNVDIPFGSPQGKELISLLMIQLPTYFPAFKESHVYKALEEMDLTSRITAKVSKSNKGKRDNILVAAVSMDDIYVVMDNKVHGKLRNLDLDIVSKLVDGVAAEFVAFKDVNLENLAEENTLYQKMSNSLAMDRFANAINRSKEIVKVKKDVSINGMNLSIEEPQELIVLDNALVVDGSDANFGDDTSDILKRVFANIKIVDVNKVKTINNEIPKGVEVPEAFKEYQVYSKSMSQARTSGGFAFDGLDSMVKYLEGTGQDYFTYGKEKDGFYYVDVAKASKRTMLPASSGLQPKKGFLASFRKDIVATSEKTTTEAGLDYERITITNNEGKSLVLAIVDDFYATITNERFLLNVLDSDNAITGVEEFSHWNNPEASSILERNLTDGGGYVSSKVVKELRRQNVINRFDSFQLRISNTIKGAVIEFGKMCDLFGADIVLTDGMVKGSNVHIDLEANGFQLFVIGQRKDSPDGIWVASQATQQMGLNAADLKEAITNTVLSVKEAVDSNSPKKLLSLLEASLHEEENEESIVEYIRLAQEFTDVLDEQYVKDQTIQAAVTKLNNLLGGKLYAKDSRVRYMFTDPIAIYNAAKAGRYTVEREDAVIQPGQIVTPSQDDKDFFMKTGKAISVRFPVTVSHEIPVLEAVEEEVYAPVIEKGLWQACTFFSAFDWAAPQQAGADFDGDTSIIIFDSVFVNARIRMNESLYGGLPVLPFLDAYVKYNEEGDAVEFDEGAPTYTPEVESIDLGSDNKSRKVEGFEVDGYTIKVPVDIDDAGRQAFFRAKAKLLQELALNSIETSLIGLIANRAMTTTDLLTRPVLTDSEKEDVEKTMLILTTAGRWEIDRPKHGGAYLQMPVMEEVFAKFDSLLFKDDSLSNKEKYDMLVKTKGSMRHLFVPILSGRKGVIEGFRVAKPQWLATQKDEYGVVRNDSLFQQFFGSQQKESDPLGYSERLIQRFCEVNNKPGTTVNNIRGRVLHNMEVPSTILEITKEKVARVYNAYREKEDLRSAINNQFRTNALDALVKKKVFRKKNINALTKAKISAKIRKEFSTEMKRLSMARELYQAEFRKEMYLLGKELGLDVRSLVGALYLVINESKTNGKVNFHKDGKEFRFSSSNGFIALPFEVFQEEMTSLLSGKISETFFSPRNTNFTLVKTRLVEGQSKAASSTPGVKASVMQPNSNTAGKTIQVNRNVKVAIRMEEQNGEVKPVMNFLNKGVDVLDPMSITQDQVAYKAFASEEAMIGVYDMHVKSVAFSQDGKVASFIFG